MAEFILNSLTMVKKVSAKCDCCGKLIKDKVTHTVKSIEELDSTRLDLEKLFWESGTHLCPECRKKFNV